MAYLARHVTSRDLDPGSYLDIDLKGQHAYISTRIDERNTVVLELCYYLL